MSKNPPGDDDRGVDAASEIGEALPDRTIAVDRATSTDAGNAPQVQAQTVTKPNSGGAPVEELDEVPPSLAKLFFKAPLDAKRRAPEPSFPKDHSSLPRGGVRAGMPVVYGARAEEHGVVPSGADVHTWIGLAPESYEVVAADRSTLMSTKRFNRRFQRAAWFGGIGVLITVCIGLWWIADVLW